MTHKDMTQQTKSPPARTRRCRMRLGLVAAAYDGTPATRTAIDGDAPADLSGARHDIFFAAVETTRMPMTVTDPRQPDCPIIFANRAFLEMTGYSREEIIGRNCRFLQGPDTDPRHRGQRARGDRAARRAGDRDPQLPQGRLQLLERAVRLARSTAQSGELVYFFGSQLDVSRRRDAEDALRQSQKMEALGQLTGGIAHDFNNLLQVMSGYLELIELQAARPAAAARRPRAPAPQCRPRARCRRRPRTLTQQLLAFSRKQKLDGRVLNLNSLVNGMRDIAERTLGTDISFRRELRRRTVELPHRPDPGRDGAAQRADQRARCDGRQRAAQVTVRTAQRDRGR